MNTQNKKFANYLQQKLWAKEVYSSGPVKEFMASHFEPGIQKTDKYIVWDTNDYSEEIEKFAKTMIRKQLRMSSGFEQTLREIAKPVPAAAKQPSKTTSYRAPER